jgi:four helix bundle protein
MTKIELKNRTKRFAIDTILFVQDLPKSKTNDVISYQLLKSATSVGANYRSACRARSTAEFISKLNIVIEEADESMYWFEIIEEVSENINKTTLKKLHTESDELTAIFTASSKTIKLNNTKFKD